MSRIGYKRLVVFILVTASIMALCSGCKKKNGEPLVNVITKVIDTEGEKPVICGANYKLGDKYEYVSSAVSNKGLECEKDGKDSITVKYGDTYPDLDGEATVIYTFKDEQLYTIELKVYGTDKDKMQDYIKDARYYCIACEFENGDTNNIYKDVEGNSIEFTDITISYEKNMYTYSIIIKAKRIYS